MKVYTAPAGIACGSCGYSVRFDECVDWRSGVAHGRCVNHRCEHDGKAFKFPLPSVEVEFIEQEQDHV